jgi:hypothetical protein
MRTPLLLCVALASSLAQAQTPEWTLRATDGPPARFGAGMAYDSVRENAVLFGGYGSSTVTPGQLVPLGDTWTWNGNAWQLAATSGPSPRANTCLAFDSKRGVVVLFGGDVNSVPRPAETWEWDGQTWALRATTGPSPRSGFNQMVFDSARGVVVWYGGSQGPNDYRADTWEWDGSVWTLRTTSGPGPRLAPGMAYDSVRQKTVVFGGSRGFPWLNDTWEWNGITWTQRPVSGPASRAAPAMTFDSVRTVSIVFAGLGVASPTFLSDTWEFDGIAWRQQPVSGPPAREGATMVFDSRRGVSVMFGGERTVNGQYVPYGDTWEYGVGCTSAAPNTQPAAQALVPGGTATFQFGVTGFGLSYRWTKDSVELTDDARISGSHSATLTITGVTSADQGDYRCVVTNACSTLQSDTAPLSCKPIILQSAPAATPQKRTLALTLGVPANAPYTYAWRRNGVPIANLAGVYSGAFTNTLRILSPDFIRGGTFDCVLTDVCGQTISASTRVCLADFNLDTNVDDADFVSFVRDYDTLLCADPTMSPGCFADFNNDTVVDDADFLFFTAAYDELLCP